MSKYWGGTLVVEDVRDMKEHELRMADPDLYRPAECPRCGDDHLHVHARPTRKPRRSSWLPLEVLILQFLCARCHATWRMLPLFLARHLWYSWRAVEQAVLPSANPMPTSAAATPPAALAVPAPTCLVPTTAPTAAQARPPPVPKRTRQRWRSRLRSSALVLVVLMAMSGGAELVKIAMQVGHLGTRAALVEEFRCVVHPRVGERLAAVGAIAHRLERGIRLM